MAQSSDDSSEGKTGAGGGWIGSLIQGFTQIFTVSTAEVTQTKVEEKNLSLRRYLIENQQLPTVINLTQVRRNVFNPILIVAMVVIVMVLIVLSMKKRSVNAS